MLLWSIKLKKSTIFLTGLSSPHYRREHNYWDCNYCSRADNNIMEYNFSNHTLGAWDYVVFALVLAVSLGIGVFFGVQRQKTNSILLAER